MLTPILTPLCAWLTLLAQAVPNRSALTFLELLVGAMITDRGFVTEALLAITPRRKWPTYFKWLEGGKWSWIAVAQHLCKILVTHFAPPVWYLVIEDTLVPRASKKAPDVGFHFDHSRKPNRSRYIWGQGWVTLAAVVHAKTVATSWAVPLISRLVRKTGNHGKLTGARVLLRVVRGLFGQGRLLLDTWFMRASVITFALEEGLTVIGQVRKDLALYQPPPARHVGQRGRTPKYGAKMTEQAVATLKETRSFLFLYGQGQIVRYHSAVVLAKFLISTEITMTARDIIDAYALRWTIEPMFCSLKHGIGVKETWQRRRQTLHRWVQILSTAFALTQMMAVYDPVSARQLAIVAPWRKERHPTAGMVKRGLAAMFRNVSLLAVWDRKCRKFSGPIAPHPLDIRDAA
jgi:hypothetical protein